MVKWLVISMFMLLPLTVEGQTNSYEKNDLPKFLKQVAHITGKTIIYDSSLNGRTVNLINVRASDPQTMLKLLHSVLEYHGYIVETTGDKTWQVIKVKRNIQGPWTQTPVFSNVEDLKKVQKEDIFVTMLIPLKYVSAYDVQKTLRALRIVNPQGGNLAAVGDTNTLLVTDFAPNVRRIYDIVRQIDQKRETTKQVSLSLEGKTIPLKIDPEMEVFASFVLYHNVAMTIANEEGQALSHLDSTGKDSKLWLTPHLSKLPKKLNFTIEVLNDDLLEKSKAAMRMEITGEIESGKKNEYQHLWNLSLNRPLPSGKKIEFSLSFSAHK